MADITTTYILRQIFDQKGAQQFLQTQQQLMKTGDRLTMTTKQQGDITKTTYKQTEKGLVAVRKSVTRLGEGMKRGSTMSQDFVRALKRVAVVVPVWFLFRNAMMAVISTISEGIKVMEEFDKAMMKAKAVIHGTSEGVTRAMPKLRDEIIALAQETGVSMTKLSSAFYRFGTVGIDFEKSMKGMEASTKMALAMMGDTDQTAKVLAQAYRLLGHTIDQTIPEQDRLTVVASQIYKLWQSNAFELNEFTGALQQFLPTANVFNISMDKTVALLASLETAGLKGSRAGRLLRTSINKLVSNLDKASNVLGYKFNPDTDDAFDALMNVLGAVRQLQREGAGIDEVVEAMGVFGGVRSKEAGMALNALYDVLIKNLNDVSTSQGKYNLLVKAFNDRVKDVENSLGVQIDRFRELRRQAGWTFVTTIMGAESSNEAMKEINILMKDLIVSAKLLARWLGNAFGVAPLMERNIEIKAKNIDKVLKTLQTAIKGEMPIDELDRLIKELEKLGTVKLIHVPPTIDKEATLRILKGIREKLEKDPNFRIEIPITVKEEGEIEPKSLEEQATQLFNKLYRIPSKYSNELIKQELDLLKIRGAKTSEIVQAKIALEKALGINQDEKSILNNLLELERAITEEKQKQNDISSETIEIWKIAQRYGEGTAMEIAEVLRGTREIEDLSRRAGLVFKRRFTGEWEKEKAREFFFRGGGVGVPITERERAKPITDIARVSRRLEARFEELGVNVNIPTIRINVNIDSEDINRKILKSIEEELKRPESNVGKVIQKRFDGM
jgi:TP901 family phage tail tape measure protein